MPSSETPWLLYQLADSGFPTGGFAHSGGLEAAVQHGAVEGAAGVLDFAQDALQQQSVSSLPLLLAAHQALFPLSAVDEEAQVFFSQRVANRASRTQGRAFFDTCARVFPAELGPLQAQTRGLKLHHAPIFGATLAHLGVSATASGELFLSGFLRALLSAAVRLGVVGPLESQRLQRSLHPALQGACARAQPWDGCSPLVQGMPCWELFGATHDQLYTRLFQS